MPQIWFANGTKSKGATRNRLRLTKALLGTRISVRVTPRRRASFQPGSLCVGPRRSTTEVVPEPPFCRAGGGRDGCGRSTGSAPSGAPCVIA